MKKKNHACVAFVFMGGLLMFCANVSAADKVVVVPLGGTVGNATASDVLKGKTFSSKTAGKGKTGTLEIRGGSTIYTNSIGMKFSLIPAGSFIMGSPDGTGDTTHRPVWPAEEHRSGDEHQHVVTLIKSFYMQTTEVTQGQWLAVMGGTNPSYFDSCGMECPVDEVSWDDAQIFIDALNAREKRTNCNTTHNTCYYYSLPTESQWEYAARAGTVTAFYNGDIAQFGNDPNLNGIGWYSLNSGYTTHPVAQKQPNNFGVYDMSGNVWEWCQDWYGAYPDGLITDPTGVSSGSNHVIRGGAWDFIAAAARSANRLSLPPDYRGYYLGFRLLLLPGQ
jgi:formylglycine-generating enzyme required for sulfatase activity